MSPPLTLVPRSLSSFETNDVPGLAEWLMAHQFEPHPPRHTLTEHSRWKRSRRLIVLYHSGSVLVQGPQIAPCLALLSELVAPAESAVLR